MKVISATKLFDAHVDADKKSVVLSAGVEQGALTTMKSGTDC